MNGQNTIEKIAQKFAVGLKQGEFVRSGDYITVRPAHVMTHDNTWAVLEKFQSIGARNISDPRQPVFTLDHDIQDQSEENLKKYRTIENFAGEMGVDFYPAGRGIGHQVMCEEGYVWPDTMVVASDSHSNIYGAMGCLGTPVVRTDAAAIWATGRTWWQIPPVAKVRLCGRLKPPVTGKDVILTLCGLFDKDEVLNHALEFCGDGVEHLTVDERLSIANMSTEWGALAGVFPCDEATIEWFAKRIRRAGEHPRLRMERLAQLGKGTLTPDSSATYAKEVVLNLETVRPCVAGPDEVKVVSSAAALARQKIRVHKAYLVSCVNSRAGDLAEAAAVVRGKKIFPGVEFYIAAASSEVQRESELRGDWQELIASGAIALPPGCGPCIGLGAGLLKDGETGISATNRNFKGRMGSREAKAYLASPAVVAASAIVGTIASVGDLDDCAPQGHIQANPSPVAVAREICVLPGFPEILEGEILFCHQDNLNTDGIYPGKYTYKKLTPEQMAKVVMENYDPAFGEIAREGDILVGGYNFGTGSSREQAATALKYRGMRAVIAGSFSETYKRNAINNGFLLIDAPGFIDDLKREFGAASPSVRTGVRARIDFRRAVVVAGQEYPIGPVGPAAQELILAGGLEAWVKRQMEVK